MLILVLNLINYLVFECFQTDFTFKRQPSLNCLHWNCIFYVLFFHTLNSFLHRKLGMQAILTLKLPSKRFFLIFNIVFCILIYMIIEPNFIQSYSNYFTTMFCLTLLLLRGVESGLWLKSCILACLLLRVTVKPGNYRFILNIFVSIRFETSSFCSSGTLPILAYRWIQNPGAKPFVSSSAKSLLTCRWLVIVSMLRRI